ncbi:putative manganese transporter [Neptunomonas sp.]|uniref:putative manganese transporter n=1 Tax=Neptunomonas sp. TaxID=1971898 RepID=UPI0035632B08
MQSIIMNPPLSLQKFGQFRSERLPYVLILLVLAIWPGELGEVTRGLMIDAYTQVAAFVATTLLLFYGVERLFNFELGAALRNAKGWQIPISAVLGSTPGCGGAVVVVAAYTSGNVSFGAVVAALTATMGDAAFLLLAARPEIALIVLPLSLVVGALTGFIVDKVNKTDYCGNIAASSELAPRIGKLRQRDFAYVAFVIPGLMIGASQLLQYDIEATWGIILPITGLAGTAIGLLVWAASPVQAMTNAADGPLTRITEETSFIAVWVIGAYLAYDYIVMYSGVDLKYVFASVAPLLPLMGVLIGLIPGCGPQVLVTTLYVNGIIPFAALMGNAISNDGDALFPAIALNPKAALMATLYSTIPAMILAYGFYFLAPDFG